MTITQKVFAVLLAVTFVTANPRLEEKRTSEEDVENHVILPLEVGFTNFKNMCSSSSCRGLDMKMINQESQTLKVGFHFQMLVTSPPDKLPKGVCSYQDGHFGICILDRYASALAAQFNPDDIHILVPEETYPLAPTRKVPVAWRSPSEYPNAFTDKSALVGEFECGDYKQASFVVVWDPPRGSFCWFDEVYQTTACADTHTYGQLPKSTEGWKFAGQGHGALQGLLQQAQRCESG